MKTSILVCALAALFVAVAPARAQILPGGGAPYLTLHLVPADPGRTSCSPEGFPGSRCDDLYRGSALNMSGELETDYDAYLVAIDVRTDRGLQRVTVGINYEVAALEILQWWGCGIPTVSPTWPAPGSNLDTGFELCQGTEPDGRDPEGDASVVLAVLRVRASAAGTLSLIPVFGMDQPAATVQDCAGAVDVVPALGVAGFDEEGFDPCMGFIEGGCDVDPDGNQWFCCGSTTDCLTGDAELSMRACEYHEGVVVIRPCSDGPLPCSVACATPVVGRTWGSIKAQYR